MDYKEHALEDCQRYSSFQPTGFDSKGAFLPDQHNWLVIPVSRTRDTGPLTESNFETALKMLGDESEDCEVHRFGHWGPGWFEIIIINPENKELLEIAGQIVCSLADYPVLDEEDYSSREYNEMLEIWNNCYSLSDRISLCQDNDINIFAARHETIPDGIYNYHLGIND